MYCLQTHTHTHSVLSQLQRSWTNKDTQYPDTPDYYVHAQFHTHLSYVSTRAVKQLIFLIALNAQLIFNHTLIAVLKHILFVTFFDFHLQVDVVGPLLLNTTIK